MKELKNVEVFHIETTNEGMFAYISYQNLDNIRDINNGFEWMKVPINPREIQLSIRDNPLVDQSKKDIVDKVSS